MKVAMSIAAFCVVVMFGRATLAKGTAADLGGILRGLGSDDAAARERAQMERAQVPQLGVLRECGRTILVTRGLCLRVELRGRWEQDCDGGGEKRVDTSGAATAA